MNTYKKIFYISSLLIGSIGLSSCEKMLEIKPEGVLLADEAVTTPEDMQKLLNSCYDALANQYNGTVQLFGDLMSDDIEKPFDGNEFRTEIWSRNTNFFNSDVGGLYGRLYIPVYRVNSMDGFYDKIEGLTDADIKRMKAEGRFIRAICHYEAVKLWAQPYGYTADNSHPGVPIRDKASQEPIQRSTVAAVYDFVIADLQYAIANLPSTNGNYANVNAAKAVLADVYFNMNKLAECRTLLDEVIAGPYTLSDSIDRFNQNLTGINNEFVFSFISNNANDNRGGQFIDRYRSDTKVPDIGLRKEIYDLITSDSTDIRSRLVGVVNEGQANEFFVSKKFNNDYFGAAYITLTKLLLMRAEVAAETGDLSTAVADINKIINRAYPGNTAKEATIALGADLLVLIREERRKELFCEGDRTYYLKRLGAFGSSSVKPVTGVTVRSAPWNCPGLALQFPSTEATAVFILNETGGCN